MTIKSGGGNKEASCGRTIVDAEEPGEEGTARHLSKSASTTKPPTLSVAVDDGDVVAPSPARDSLKSDGSGEHHLLIGFAVPFFYCARSPTLAVSSPCPPVWFTTDRIDWGSNCGLNHIKPSNIRALRKATRFGSSKDGGSKTGISRSWTGYNRSASTGLRMSSNLAAVTMSASSIITDINNLLCIRVLWCLFWVLT